MWRLFSFLLLLTCCALPTVAQDTPAPNPEAQAQVTLEPPAPAPTPAATAPDPAAPGDVPASAVAEQLTLMTMIEQGGVILWVTMGIGFIGVVLALYLLLTVTPRREAPPSLIKRAHKQISNGDLREAYRMVEDRDELLANVLRVGLKLAGHERYVIQEAMESEAERGAAALWQRITYLYNIATITPLLGLLGTVWGMMQAFSSIALDSAQVKGLMMAYSVSQAMITTAGGLVVAIPAMAVYYLLRGRVIKIVATVEANASEFLEMILRGHER